MLFVIILIPSNHIKTQAFQLLEQKLGLSGCKVGETLFSGFRDVSSHFSWPTIRILNGRRDRKPTIGDQNIRINIHKFSENCSLNTTIDLNLM